MENKLPLTEVINQLTHKIIGCAMQVHRTLGSGFQEVIYQRALAIELTFNGLAFTREQEMDIFYREQVIGTRRVDFFVNEKVMLKSKRLNCSSKYIKHRLSIIARLIILQTDYLSISEEQV